MDRHMKDSLDHWLTTPPDAYEPDCDCDNIAWHGSRPECQAEDCSCLCPVCKSDEPEDM